MFENLANVIFKRLFIILAFLFSAVQIQAQRDEQLWLEYQLSYPFGGKYLLENTAAYQTLLNPENKWWSFSTSPTFEMTVATWFDLLSEVGIAYTLQKENANTFEIAPMVGGRFFFTQGKKVDVRFVLRYQQRNFKDIETSDWTSSNRTRLRGEVFVCINGPSLFTNKLWYALADYEEFIVFDQQLEERFANRRRARIGVGYRLSYKHRFEFGYTIQSSRNEIDEEFTGTDNVIQFKYKMFLNPARPVTTD
jgi:flagella basal body P-ring formation protein FlgA